MIVVALGDVNPMRPQSYEKGMEYEKTQKSRDQWSRLRINK
jgi:hypothetical protein